MQRFGIRVAEFRLDVLAMCFHRLAADSEVLSDREMAVFALIAAGHGTGQIAKELGICRKTVETHCEHIKLKLRYPDAEALHRGARESLGTAEYLAQNP